MEPERPPQDDDRAVLPAGETGADGVDAGRLGRGGGGRGWRQAHQLAKQRADPRHHARHAIEQARGEVGLGQEGQERRQEAPAEVPAEQVQAVVERSEHTHEGCRLFRGKPEVLRGVQDQRRIEQRKDDRGKDLHEKQHAGALRYVRELALDRGTLSRVQS